VLKYMYAIVSEETDRIIKTFDTEYEAYAFMKILHFKTYIMIVNSDGEELAA
jgi:hypothetical protein